MFVRELVPLTIVCAVLVLAIRTGNLELTHVLALAFAAQARSRPATEAKGGMLGVALSLLGLKLGRWWA